MKTIYKTIAFTIIGLVVLSCSPSISLVSVNTLRSDFVLVDARSNLYCSKYEVTNKEYRTFLAYLKSHDEKEFQLCKIDSLQWEKLEPANTPFKRNYAWHPAFDNYPVVNISYHGATQYCAWLNTLYPNDDLSFRLPSSSEFKKVMDGLDITLQSDEASDYNCPNFNLNFIDNPAIDGAQFCAPAKGFKKEQRDLMVQEENGMLHLVGNISEYLSDGSAAGGSWNAYPSQVQDIPTIVNADPTVGFRVWYEKIK